MELTKITEITIKANNGIEVRPGMTVMYNTKNDKTSRVAKFLGLSNGMFEFVAFATEENYKVKPSTIEDMFVVEVTF